MTDWAPITKRLEDICIGTLLLLVTAPLWPLIALAIKLESPGPVLFRQRRRGRYLTVINVLKFRTMRVLEDGPVVEQARANDTRVTAVGRFLRRSSLDELPQLINVIKGEMSLVGPRPHALAHDVEFAALLDKYPDRHQMKPGITGLAQVSGLRGSTAIPGTIEARVEADLAYIKAWSLELDAKILLGTFAAVVSGKNAD
ncbi:MAG: sugar transferase [Hyphomicrobium sp.]